MDFADLTDLGGISSDIEEGELRKGGGSRGAKESKRRKRKSCLIL